MTGNAPPPLDHLVHLGQPSLLCRGGDKRKGVVIAIPVVRNVGGVTAKDSQQEAGLLGDASSPLMVFMYRF